MIPKIEFRYSWIYNEICKENSEKKEYPSQKEIKQFIQNIREVWKGNGKRILKKIEDITKIKWNEENIICYVVGKAIPFSDPLTMPICKDEDIFIDTLTHELIHRNFIQNMEKAEEMMKPINKKYKNQNLNVRIHVLVNRVHKNIFEDFGRENRLKKRIKRMSELEDYKRAWEIVMKE